MSFFGNLFRSLGQLAFGLIGGAVGGPIGFAIGSMIGGMLLGPKPQQPGQTNLEVQLSQEGVFLPRIYGGPQSDGSAGGIVISGNVVDCSPHGGISQDGSDLFLSCAIALADAGTGPVICDSIEAYNGTNRVTIYDRGGAQPGYTLTYDAATGAETSGTGANSLALYRGTENQPVDPIVASWHNGVAVYPGGPTATGASAMRGTAYARLNLLPLAPFNNSIPTLRFRLRNGITNVVTILTAELVLAGVPSSAIDLSAIPGALTIRGAVVSSLAAPRAFIEQIAAFVFCDLIEVDGKIKGSDRRNPTTYTLTEDELGTHDTGAGGKSQGATLPPRITVRQQPLVDLPSDLTVNYYDPDVFYKRVPAQARRQTATHQNHQTLELPIVARAAEMATWTQRALDEAWAARDQYEIALPPGRLRIAPGDVVIVPLDDRTQKVRVTSQTLGTPGPLTIQGDSYNPDIYIPTRAASQTSRPAPAVNTTDAPNLFMWDGNALNDADNDLPGFYAAGHFPTTIYGGYGLLCTLYGMLRTGSAANYVRFYAQSTIGVAATALPQGTSDPVTSPTTFDMVSTVTVDIGSDKTLTNASASNILSAGYNLAYLGLANGGEYFHFQTATYDAAGSPAGKKRYVLSGLLRGRRGTETYLNAHAVNDTFVLINDANAATFSPVQRCNLQPSALNTALNYVLRVISGNGAVANNGFMGTPIPFTAHGNNLRPYAPKALAGTADGTHNVTFTWSRRSRFEAVDATLPLGETVEKYDVEILNAAGTAVVRTFSNLTAPTVTYSKTQQDADFASVTQTSLNIRVYQISSVVGRGYAASATIGGL